MASEAAVHSCGRNQDTVQPGLPRTGPGRGPARGHRSTGDLGSGRDGGCLLPPLLLAPHQPSFGRHFPSPCRCWASGQMSECRSSSRPVSPALWGHMIEQGGLKSRFLSSLWGLVLLVSGSFWSLGTGERTCTPHPGRLSYPEPRPKTTAPARSSQEACSRVGLCHPPPRPEMTPPISAELWVLSEPGVPHHGRMTIVTLPLSGLLWCSGIPSSLYFPSGELQTVGMGSKRTQLGV